MAKSIFTDFKFFMERSDYSLQLQMDHALVMHLYETWILVQLYILCHFDFINTCPDTKRDVGININGFSPPKRIHLDRELFENCESFFTHPLPSISNLIFEK